jgi:hypothetical protein
MAKRKKKKKLFPLNLLIAILIAIILLLSVQTSLKTTPIVLKPGETQIIVAGSSSASLTPERMQVITGQALKASIIEFFIR